MLVVSKANFIIGAFALIAIGGTSAGFAYAITTDECARAPDGTFHWELLGDGFAHLNDRDAACDPWKVVAPDPDVMSITIGSISGLDLKPSRQVRIESGGTIAVLEPTDEMRMETRVIARGKDPALARELLGRLSRITRYNRLPDKLPEGADLSNPQTYLAAPVMRCTGTIYDGGSASAQFNLRNRANQVSIYESSCASLAYSLAMEAFDEAHQKGYKATGFQGSKYIESRKGT